MERYIDINKAFTQKPEIVNLAIWLDKYFKQRVKTEKPDPETYSRMYDFIKQKKSKILGVSYLPNSKFERRFASKLYDILNLETIINRKIAASWDNELDESTYRRNNKLYETRQELFSIIFTDIYLAKDTERKILNTFHPSELVNMYDFFEEETVKVRSKYDIDQREEELAVWVSGDEDETDVAETFYEKVIRHHEQNRPIGLILEDVVNSRDISSNRVFRKTLEKAHILRSYFKKYPEVFIMSYISLFTYKQMNQAVEAIFPEEYSLPDIRTYIDWRYDIKNPDEQYRDDD